MPYMSTHITSQLHKMKDPYYQLIRRSLLVLVFYSEVAMVQGDPPVSGAVVPYVESNILQRFHDDEKTVIIDGHRYTLAQKWNDNGVSGVLWDSAVVLAEYVAAHPETVQNRSVLELGAGLGLPSIVASRVGASSVDATDQQSAIPLLTHNIRRNTPKEAQIEIYSLDWMTDQPRSRYQVVLGADLVYNKELFKPLSRIMKGSCDRSTVILFSSRIRYPKDERFYSDLEGDGFLVRKEYYDSDSDVHIFRITLSGNNEL